MDIKAHILNQLLFLILMKFVTNFQFMIVENIVSNAEALGAVCLRHGTVMVMKIVLMALMKIQLCAVSKFLKEIIN